MNSKDAIFFISIKLIPCQVRMQKSCQRQLNWNDGMGLHFTGLISLMDSSNKNAWKSASSFYLIYSWNSLLVHQKLDSHVHKLVTNMLLIPFKVEKR